MTDVFLHLIQPKLRSIFGEHYYRYVEREHFARKVFLQKKTNPIFRLFRPLDFVRLLDWAALIITQDSDILDVLHLLRRLDGCSSLRSSGSEQRKPLFQERHHFQQIVNIAR